MTFFQLVALTQFIGLLIGLALVYYIDPENSVGALILIAIALVVSNVVTLFYSICVRNNRRGFNLAMPSPGVSGRLDGATLGKLTDLIASAFDDEGLEELVRTKMDVDLYDELVEPNQKRKTLVFKLLEAMEQRGTTEQFLRAVLQERPERPDLRECILNHYPEALADSQSQAKGETKGGLVLGFTSQE